MRLWPPFFEAEVSAGLKQPGNCNDENAGDGQIGARVPFIKVALKRSLEGEPSGENASRRAKRSG